MTLDAGVADLSSVSVAELAEGICLRAGRIAAAQAELLLWIGEFDRREGWAGPGTLSCAHWLSWRVGLSLGAARERVRVARRLPAVPEVAAAFADGRLSFSKVRAITRAAEPDDGVDWVELGRHSSGAQLEQLVRGVQRARALAEPVADPELLAWQLRATKRFDARGNARFSFTVLAEHAPVVEQGLEAMRAALQRTVDAQFAADRAATAERADAADRGAATAPADSRPAGGAGPARAKRAAGSPPDSESGGLPRGAESAEDVSAGTSEPPRSPGPEDVSAETSQPPGGPGPEDVSAATSEPPSDASPEDVSAETSQPPGGPGPEDVSEEPLEPLRVTEAQAWVALAEQALAAEQADRPDLARRRRAKLTTRIDPLSGWARLADGELLPPLSLRQAAESLPGRGRGRAFERWRLRPLTDADLRRADLGRTQRTVSDRLRALLGVLDGERCRFPGCTRHTNLHAHHVVFWRDGGPTDLANLVLVCPRHHTLIHAQGFGLVLQVDRTLTVHTAEGVPLLHHPAQPWGDPAGLADGPGEGVSAETLPPDHCTDRLDLGYAVAVLLAQAA